MQHMIIDWLVYRGAIYAAVAAYAGWHVLRPHLPHRHTGYVSINGAVHRCSLCDALPADLARQHAEVRDYARQHPWVLLHPDVDRYSPQT